MQVVYAAIDNLLFLSKFESFGLVIAEAMASGVPVVGIAGEGGYLDPEYPLVTRDNALLLRPDKFLARIEPIPDSLLVSLARAIMSLRNSPEARSSMAKCAWNWVKDHFDIRGKVGELADLYDTLV
jgi:glycosyltransferase involved in cell wall biosynthesis